MHDPDSGTRFACRPRDDGLAGVGIPSSPVCLHAACEEDIIRRCVLGSRSSWACLRLVTPSRHPRAARCGLKIRMGCGPRNAPRLTGREPSRCRPADRTAGFKIPHPAPDAGLRRRCPQRSMTASSTESAGGHAVTDSSADGPPLRRRAGATRGSAMALGRLQLSPGEAGPT